jgi:serine/threonine protein phosphatase PrpC
MAIAEPISVATSIAVYAEEDVAAGSVAAAAVEIEATATALDDPAPAAPTPVFTDGRTPPFAPEPPPARLAIGEIVAGRFAIIAVEVQEEGGVIYRAEDRGVCPTCGAAMQATEEEPYCFECGAYLLAPDLLRPVRCLRPAAPDACTGETVWAGDQPFCVLAEETPTPSAQEPTAGGGAVFPQGVSLLAGQRSDVGLARADRPDEDSVFALTLAALYESRATPSLGLYFVADGMGGHGDGEVASRMVAETMSAALLQSVVLPAVQGKRFAPETVEALLDSAVQLANRLVRQAATAHANDMGSTLTLALVIDGHAFVANVGDSRTYLWRGGLLQQITEDHSAVYQLYRAGALSEEGIYTHPRRNEITRNMGFRTTVQADYFQVELLPGDLLLLCCDGLWEMLHNDGIADLFLVSYGDPQRICDELVKRANQAGGDDNISVIVVQVQA